MQPGVVPHEERRGGTQVKSFCAHTPHIRITNIWEPRYSTKDVLVNVNKLKQGIEHYLIHFEKAKSMPGWYYVSLRDLAKSPRQKNGYGTMLVVPLSKLEDFEPIKRCDHAD